MGKAVLITVAVMWLAASISGGDMLLDCVSDLSEDMDRPGGNVYAGILLTTLACLIAAPWLIIKAIATEIERSTY